MRGWFVSSGLPVQVVGKAGIDDIRHNRGSSGDGIQDHGDNCSLKLRKNHFNAGRVQLKHLNKGKARSHYDPKEPAENTE
jgi:hypothetical protein